MLNFHTFYALEYLLSTVGRHIPRMLITNFYDVPCGRATSTPDNLLTFLPNRSCQSRFFRAHVHSIATFFFFFFKRARRTFPKSLLKNIISVLSYENHRRCVIVCHSKRYRIIALFDTSRRYFS